MVRAGAETCSLRIISGFGRDMLVAPVGAIGWRDLVGGAGLGLVFGLVCYVDQLRG